MLKNVLIPLDGSPQSETILPYIRALIGGENTEAILTYVTHVMTEESDKDFEAFTKPTRTRLKELGESLQAPYQIEIRAGDPTLEILQLAQEISPSLIALATREKSIFERWIWGSHAERLLRRCPLPLLIVPPTPEDENESELEFKPFERILVPLDGSEEAASILPMVSEISVRMDSEVVLLYVAPEDEEFPDPDGFLDPFGKSLEKRGISVVKRVQSGRIVREIFEAIYDGKVDLLAMTTHGKSEGFGRWLFGSISERVLPNCPCSMLVHRTAGFTEWDDSNNWWREPA